MPESPVSWEELNNLRARRPDIQPLPFDEAMIVAQDLAMETGELVYLIPASFADEPEYSPKCGWIAERVAEREDGTATLSGEPALIVQPTCVVCPVWWLGDTHADATVNYADGGEALRQKAAEVEAGSRYHLFEIVAKSAKQNAEALRDQGGASDGS